MFIFITNLDVHLYDFNLFTKNKDVAKITPSCSLSYSRFYLHMPHFEKICFYYKCLQH